MRVYSVPALWVLIAATLGGARVAAAEGPDVTGDYQCVGDAGDGKQYQGKVKISREGDCYRVKWEIGGDRYTGLGIREGDSLSVAIRQDGNATYTGVMAYRIDKGGKLAGRWSVFGTKGKTYTETLTPERADTPSRTEDQPEFKKVTSEAGKFTVEMPGKVTEKSETVDDIVIHKLSAVVSNSLVFMVGWYDEPEAKKAKDPQEYMRRLSRASWDGRITNDKQLMLGDRNVPGLEFRVQQGPNRVRERIYLDGGRVYRVTAIGNLGTIESRDVQRFLDSFRIAD